MIFFFLRILVSWSFHVGGIPSQLFHENDVVSFATPGHLPLYSMTFKLGFISIKK